MVDELSEASSRTNDIDAAATMAVRERGSLIAEAVHVAKDEAAFFRSILFWIVWAVFAISGGIAVIVVISRYRLDPLVVLACWAFVSICSVFLCLDLLNWDMLRTCVLVSKPIGIGTGVITFVILIFVFRTDSPRWGLHMAWFLPVCLAVDWSVTRGAYAICSTSYRKRCVDLGSTVPQQQLLMVPAAIAISAVVLSIMGAVFVARYLGTRSPVGEVIVNGLVLPLAKAFVKKMLWFSGGAVQSAAADAQSSSLLGVCSNMPGAVLTSLSTSWLSYFSCIFLGACIQIIVDNIHVHLAVAGGIGGIRDMLSIVRGFGTTEERSQEATVQTNSPGCGFKMHDASDLDCGEAPRADPTNIRDQKQSCFEDDLENVLPGFVNEVNAEDPVLEACSKGTSDKMVDESSHVVAPAQSGSFLGIVPVAVENEPTHCTSTGLRLSAHYRELLRRQEYRLFIEDRVDKFVALTAPAVAAVATSASRQGVVVPWSVLLARTGINIVLEVAVDVLKSTYFRRRYDIVPSRALEHAASQCNVTVAAWWFLGMTALCSQMSLAFYVVSTM